MKPTFVAMPKNEHGKLEDAAARCGSVVHCAVVNEPLPLSISLSLYIHIHIYIYIYIRKLLRDGCVFDTYTHIYI